MLLNVTLFRDGYTFFLLLFAQQGEKTRIDLEEKTSRRQFTVMAASEGHYTKTKEFVVNFFSNRKMLRNARAKLPQFLGHLYTREFTICERVGDGVSSGYLQK